MEYSVVSKPPVNLPSIARNGKLLCALVPLDLAQMSHDEAVVFAERIVALLNATNGRANARLIAAAPILLAFAEYVLEMDNESEAPLFVRARAAIDAATGETECSERELAMSEETLTASKSENDYLKRTAFAQENQE